MDEKYYLYVLNAYEKKLKELMGENDYHEFAKEVAKEGFKEEINGMADSDFKNFCLENFDKITED